MVMIMVTAKKVNPLRHPLDSVIPVSRRILTLGGACSWSLIVVVVVVMTCRGSKVSSGIVWVDAFVGMDVIDAYQDPYS